METKIDINTLDKKIIKNLNFFYQKHTSDYHTLSHNDYKKCNFTQDDIWLDIGANIGIFSVLNSNKVKFIYSYEPDNRAYEILNLSLLENKIDNVKTFNEAIVHNNNEYNDFYFSKSSVLNSLVKPKYKSTLSKVKCSNIIDIISKYNINKIKMDIEGGEQLLFPVLENNLSNIQELIMEYHGFNNNYNIDYYLNIFNNNFNYVECNKIKNYRDVSLIYGKKIKIDTNG